MTGILKRLFSWKNLAAFLAIVLLSLAPVSPYVPTLLPADGTCIVHGIGDDVVVFATRTGSAYHRAGCHHLARSALPIRLSEAAGKYRPCSACRPPRIDRTIVGNRASRVHL